MNLNAKRYAIFRALQMQKYNGGLPSLTVRNTPTLTSNTSSEPPMNKAARLRRMLMDEAAIAEVRKRTGSSPFVEVHFV